MIIIGAHQTRHPKTNTVYEETVHLIKVRENPTTQSSIFTGHEYTRRVPEQKRLDILKIDPSLLFMNLKKEQGDNTSHTMKAIIKIKDIGTPKAFMLEIDQQAFLN